MPKPFMARDGPHYGNTADYYYPPAAPFMPGPAGLMPTTMIMNQFGPTPPPPPPPHQGYYHHPLPLPQQQQQQQQQQQHPQIHPQALPLPPPTSSSSSSSSTTLPLLPTTTATGATTPTTNGTISTTTTTTTAATTTTNAPTTDQEYCDFLYHVGFLQGRLADTFLTIPALNKTYSLHALVVARSPTLHRLLVSTDQQQQSTTKTGNKYRLEITDMPGSVIEEALYATLGHLYRPMMLPDIMYLFARPRVLLSILDVADYLDIQPLTMMIYDALGHEWNLETILFWLPYLSSSSSGASFDYGVHYLTLTLPQQLESFHYNGDYMDLAHVYAHLPPHGLLERCIEADQLPVRDPMQRLDFAKQVMALRKQWMEVDDGISVALRFNHGEVTVRVIHPPSP
ncbi:hypothetical protein BC941DRAFT_442539 [Chlamydoabsidia padenii]|nr:hypothetical protein BC941DRAFT_442539 [Chlamydoabsidia padenii]